jgi:hypothetical protein
MWGAMVHKANRLKFLSYLETIMMTIEFVTQYDS